MSALQAYLLGLATLPGLGGLWLLLAFAALKSNTINLWCSCGKQWGSPNERGWRVWWEPLVLVAHKKTKRHRAWAALDNI